MPCYTESPSESQILYDRIFVCFLSKDPEQRKIGFEYIKELVFAYVKMHAERNKMGNILCDLGKIYDEQGSDVDSLCIVPNNFWEWWGIHKKVDAKKDRSLPPPESLFSFDPNYVEMGK